MDNTLNSQKIHYNDVIMIAMASQITSLTIVYSTVYSGSHQRKHQSFASLAFVRGIHRWPVNSPHKWPVTWKMFPFDDVFMRYIYEVPGSIFEKHDPVIMGPGSVKGIKNGWPCIVEIRGTQGCALVGDPARAVGECRDVAKAQP